MFHKKREDQILEKKQDLTPYLRKIGILMITVLVSVVERSVLPCKYIGSVADSAEVQRGVNVIGAMHGVAFKNPVCGKSRVGKQQNAVMRGLKMEL